MIEIAFKNVGQGDSIILSWIGEGNSVRYGVIDCNVYRGSNPLLNELRLLEPEVIDFVILTHPHEDHYSGFGELLKYFRLEKIVVKLFIHTLMGEFLTIMSKAHLSQRKQGFLNSFLEEMDLASKANIIEDFVLASNKSEAIGLSSKVSLRFLAPNGNDYHKVVLERHRQERDKLKVQPDLNFLSTILSVSSDEKAIILTSDAPTRSLKRISSIVNWEILLLQVPHHGSLRNHLIEFWENRTYAKDCPAVFSVGDVARDKLPNKEVVEYFDTLGCYVESTNPVYGIKDYFQLDSIPDDLHIKIERLNMFSTARSEIRGLTVNSQDRFSGDKRYKFDLN